MEDFNIEEYTELREKVMKLKESLAMDSITDVLLMMIYNRTFDFEDNTPDTP